MIPCPMPLSSITSKDLLGRLQNALYLEETGISLYTKHLANTLFFSGFSESKRVRMQEILALLASESKGHEATLYNVIEFVNSSGLDVYPREF